MAKHTVRDRRREAYWRGVVEGQGRSGLTVRAFCRKGNLTESAFYFWRRELARREAEQEQTHRKRGKAKRATNVEPPAFMSVRVTDEMPPPPAAPIEIVLSGGHRVHVTAPVDRQALADVLAVLEGQAC